MTRAVEWARRGRGRGLGAEEECFLLLVDGDARRQFPYRLTGQRVIEVVTVVALIEHLGPWMRFGSWWWWW